jgi:hypothetical protein
VSGELHEAINEIIVDETWVTYERVGQDAVVAGTGLAADAILAMPEMQELLAHERRLDAAVTLWGKALEDQANTIATLTADLAAERAEFSAILGDAIAKDAEIERLREGMELAWGLIANGQYWDRTDGRRYGEWNEARAKWRDGHWHPALDRNKGGPS